MCQFKPCLYPILMSSMKITANAAEEWMVLYSLSYASGFENHIGTIILQLSSKKEVVDITRVVTVLPI